MNSISGTGGPLAALTKPGFPGGRAWTVGLALAAMLGSVAFLVPQVAAATEPVVSPGATVRLLEGGVDASGTARFGLEIDLEPGWKTYWRSPGDGGFPPEIDLSASTNLAKAVVLWPAPHRQTFLGFKTLGYGGQVVLPIEGRLSDPAAPARLDLKGVLYVCSDICTRVDIAFATDVRAGEAGEPGAVERIAAFRAKVPNDGAATGMTIAGAGVVQTPAGPALRVVATARDTFRSPDLLVETDPPLAFGAPKARFADDRRRVELTTPLAQPLPAGATLAGMAARLTLLDNGQAMETKVSVSAEPMVNEEGWQPEGGPDLLALASMLASALLGGLVLNLMPCVLPVLSLKLVSLARHGGSAAREVRLGFLASAAGILASFLVLATAMAGLKAAGAAVGWGIQFQQPLFLVLLVLLLTLFSLNLLGAFEIPLPRRLADRMGGRGRGHGTGGSLAGHFATGAFATLLATPCSAPFLGTAVGFALARGPVEIYAVFTALGLGLALPYLLVAGFPRLAARLPKPGRWMLTLRRLLAVPLALTTAWLLSVLAAQLGPAAALLVAALTAALALTLWGAGGGQARSGRLVALTVAALASAAFLTPLAASRGPAAADSGPRAAAGVDWVRFDAGEIGRRVAAGEVVFVDVTADWCITCKVNERVVLADDAVGRRLMAGDVTPMLADWTRPDAAIAAYLQGFGRYGIPFTAVYGPAAPDGIVLPELLTKERVLNALDAAAGRPS